MSRTPADLQVPSAKGAFSGLNTGRIKRLMDEIKPEPLEARHLNDLAELHYRQLPWSLNGQFGREHINDLYRALFSCPYFFGYVYYSNGRLVAFVTATTDYRETRKRIMTAYRGKVLQMLHVILRHPRFFWALVESKFIVPFIFRQYNARAEWLTFITADGTHFLSPFVSLKLMEHLRLHYQRAGIPFYMAQGFKDNPKAMRMYEKLDWRIVSRLLMHNIYHYSSQDDAAAVTSP